MAIKKTPAPKAAPVAKKKVRAKKTPVATKVTDTGSATAEKPAPVTKKAAPVTKKVAAATKKAAVRKAPVAPRRAASQDVVSEAVNPEQRYKMIASMAYFRAEQRGFAPGWETHDWLESEKEVDEMLRRRQKS